MELTKIEQKIFEESFLKLEEFKPSTKDVEGNAELILPKYDIKNNKIRNHKKDINLPLSEKLKRQAKHKEHSISVQAKHKAEDKYYSL